MNQLRRGVRVYSLLLRLYPRKHRDEYGQQMMQMVEDMLNDAPSTASQMSAWIRIIADLPVSVCKEQLESIGENMQAQSSHRIQFGTIAALLAALIGAGFPTGNKILVAVGAADAPLRFPTPLQGFLFPAIALLIAGIILLTFKISSQQKQVSTRRMWLIAAIAAIAFLNIAALVFDLATRP